VAGLATGCFQTMTPPGDGDGDGDGDGSAIDAIEYRDDLTAHPGCATAGMSYAPAAIAGYGCAAKAYPFPAGVAEDPGKPIVLLFHGNSDSPQEWERYPEDGEPMLAERLVAAGYRTLAIDFRIDQVDDPQTNNDTENAARNIDHGWAVPLAEALIRAVLAAEPGRRVSLVGFSLGVTVVRDALRRLYLAGDQPFDRLDHVLLLAGANHGVSTFSRLCGKNPTMRGRVACQMGSRDNFSPTPFMRSLNGPDGAWETPCADGDHAFGDAGACGGNAVGWTTIVMEDISDGTYQDEFVSEDSSALAGADNRLIGLEDVDQSGYFFNGLLKNHYGSCRSAAALAIATEVL
jgi:pimeloyl-ACP methyl ester carboxylesterase